MTDDGTFQAGYALSRTAGILILAGGFVRSFLWAAVGWENGLMGRLFGSPWGAWPSGVIGIAYGIAIIVLVTLLPRPTRTQSVLFSVAIIILSLASSFGALAGLGLGLLLGVLGGALVLSGPKSQG